MAQIELPNLQKLEADGKEALEVVKQYVCKTEQDYVSCCNFFRWVKARKKEVKADLDKDLEPKIKVLDQLHSEGCALRKKVMDPFDQAEEWIEKLMKPYLLEQKRIADEKKNEQQRRADAEAAEEKELLRLQAEIEGRPEEAALIGQLPAVAAQVKDKPAVEKQKDVSIRDKWTWAIVDENLIPHQFWILDTQAITKLVNKWGAKTQVPGIKVVPDVTIAG